MKIGNMTSRTALCALSICAGLGTACKKSPEPPALSLAAPTTPSSRVVSPHVMDEAERAAQINNDPKLTESQKSFLLTYVPETVARDRQAIKDRLELVLPPPSGWKPENTRRKLKMTLTLEKTEIHVGDTFCYRVETQNAGREPISFSESAPGFIKDGGLHDHWFGLYITPPGSEPAPMGHIVLPGTFDPSHFHEYHFPDSMTTAEKDAAFERIKIEGKVESDLWVTVQSGETLITRPNPPPPNRFRCLKPHFRIQKPGAKNFEIQLGFQKPGTYNIKAVYDDRPLPPPPEKHIQAMIKDGYSRKDQMKSYEDNVRERLGFVESNVILLTVVP